jgi:ABC-type nitrate/sulfonate/bicarbonate transport system ATPase subunit
LSVSDNNSISIGEGSPLAPIVELRDVSKAYLLPNGEKRLAITDISLRINDVPGRGQTRVLLGPSGSGKSTILKLVAGLTMPTSGQILLDGRPVTGPGSDRGMVFQSYSSFPWLTVLENVRFGMSLQGVSRREATEVATDLVKRVGLAGTESLYPDNLSGGMRQRVAIARTLACKPRIILMDEPFGALDPKVRVEMQDLVASLWADSELNPTIIFVTHDVQEAIFLADSIIVLSKGPGRILAEFETPPPTAQTRREMNQGMYRELQNQILEVIYGEESSDNIVESHETMLKA